MSKLMKYAADCTRMKAWYVMVHFAGPYVNGFVVPQALDEKHALQQLRFILRVRRKVKLAMGKSDDWGGDGDSPKKLQDYIRSLRRPWRNPGERRHNNEKKAIGSGDRGSKMVRVVELTQPVHAGYWLKDIIQGREHCNIH